MITWLLVALIGSASVSILFGVFLAGSLRLRNLPWAGLLAGMGVAVVAVILASSIDSLPSVSEPKPLGIARLILETSAYGAVVKGLIIGLPVPVIGLVAIHYAFRNFDRWSVPLSTSFIGLVIIVLFLGVLNAPAADVISGSLIVRQPSPAPTGSAPTGPPPTLIPFRPTLTPSPTAGESPMPPNFKVAFIGDQGLGANSVAVLQLIRDEGADMVSVIVILLDHVDVINRRSRQDDRYAGLGRDVGGLLG